MSKENFRSEVEKFKKSFKEDALALAEKSITLEKRGNIALLVFDQHQEKANKLSGANMLRIYELLTKVEDDKSYKALVAISRKPTIFIAGADIGEIRMFGKEGSATENLMKLQAVFTFLDYLSIPTVAAIHGACMGGGTEFALSCDYRMCTDDPATKIALPEVMLGLIPGWGGTQRLPKLIGLEKALDMILTGKNIDSRKAKKMGLVDKVVPVEYLEERAIKWAEELAEGKGKPAPKKRELKDTLLENVPGGKWVVIDQARKMVLSKTNGNYPAPLSALEVIKKTFGGDLEAGLQVRQLEYQTALDDLRSASLAFNNIRGKKNSDVPEELPSMDRTVTEKINIPEKKGAREDVKAAEQLTKVSAASADLGYEKNLPTLDVFGTVSLNGRDDTRGTAFSDSFKTDHPSYAVGIKFQAPINFLLTNDIRSAYAKEMKASELTFRRKQFEEEEQWNDLTKKLSEAKEKLRLTFLIEDSQSKKLERERERLKLGRSVTFQVLQFEQDYALSQMLRLKTQGEVLGLSAQLRTYGESK